MSIPAISFHCGKNIYLLGPREGLQLIIGLLRATNESQIKPIMKQRNNVLRHLKLTGVSDNSIDILSQQNHQLNPGGPRNRNKNFRLVLSLGNHKV